MIKIINMIFFSKKQTYNLFLIDFTQHRNRKCLPVSKSPIKMYRNYTVCVHVHNLHPGANKFAPPRRQEQICTRVQILKTPFTWPKIHPGCKFAPRVQICTRVQFAHMNEAIDISWDRGGLSSTKIIFAARKLTVRRTV